MFLAFTIAAARRGDSQGDTESVLCSLHEILGSLRSLRLTTRKVT
jgi:hypothetical protein